MVPAIDIPSDSAPMPLIWTFALTYNAYDRHGGFEGAAEIGNASEAQWRRDGVLPADLDTARASLFFEQRRYHHFGSDPEGDAERYVRSLVRQIRDLSGATVAGPADPLP
jgi:hypothetical protein